VSKALEEGLLAFLANCHRSEDDVHGGFLLGCHGCDGLVEGSSKMWRNNVERRTEREPRYLNHPLVSTTSRVVMEHTTKHSFV
jgi:hypothetical protein